LLIVAIYDSNYPGETHFAKFHKVGPKGFEVDNYPYDRAISWLPAEVSNRAFWGKLIRQLVDYIKDTMSFYILVVACPVNVTITDEYGRIINDLGTNQIPNASVYSGDELKIFYLPLNLTYVVTG